MKNRLNTKKVSVPKCLREFVSQDIQDELAKDGHGIVFKQYGIIRVMYWLKGIDLGESLTVERTKDYDSVILKAMKIQRLLRSEFDSKQPPPQKNQMIGLHIPEKFTNKISEDLKKKLMNDGHGLSFLPHNVIQQRFVRDKIDYGRLYKLRDFVSLESLLLDAVANCERLRKKMPHRIDNPDPNKGISLIKRKRNGALKTSYELNYVVSYRTNCDKSFCKKFYVGSYTDCISEIAERKFVHAYKTARHFRKLYCEQLDESVFWHVNTENWQNRKYYQEFVNPADDNVETAVEDVTSFEDALKLLREYKMSEPAAV
jgi:hypothetical protein